MTAIAVLPVAAVWLASQGPYSYFFPRYLLLTVGAWAVLAGIALSRLDLKIAVASLAVIAILGAGDQQVIRAPGAHDWSTYPVGRGGSYQGYAQAAQVVARQARPGDGIVYQSQAGEDKWLMIGYGLEYYLARDLRPGTPLPRQLFIAETGAQAHGLYPLPCQQPAALGPNASDRQRLPAQPVLRGNPGPGGPAAAALPAQRGQARTKPDRVPARADVTEDRRHEPRSVRQKSSKARPGT
jgi:hypothetical protein